MTTYFNGTKLHFDDVLDNIIQIYVITDQLKQGMDQQDLDLAESEEDSSPIVKIFQGEAKHAGQSFANVTNIREKFMEARSNL